MQYVEGETLADKLKREKMPLREVLHIAIQVVDALDEAHAHGIIHRDIKPANIIINARGQAKVLDFGVAKFAEDLEAKSNIAAAKLSSKSGIMGTVPYMSPEQVCGKELDARTDIFSLGAMLYEMACGRSPFARDTDAETISAILRDEPSWAEIPADLQPIVQKSLMKDADERYQTAKDLVADLRELQEHSEMEIATPSAPERFGISSSGGKLTDAQTDPKQAQRPSSAESIVSQIKKHKTASLALVSILLLASAGLGLWRFSNRRPNTTKLASLTQIRSIAVLPLENLSGDPAQEYFADGMTESVISNLARIRALKVISRTSAMRYKGSQKSLPEIARELNVDAVVEGTVQRSGGRVRVTAQLIHPATDTHLWARDYERDLTDVLKLQSEVARAVADEIRTQVTAEERARLASTRRVKPQAHEAYLLGRFHFNKVNEQGCKEAIKYFERAIKLDPDYAAAYAGLSRAWQFRGVLGSKDFREVESLAREPALKAIALDEQLAEAHISLGNIKYHYDWDWAGSEQEFRRAVELDPGGLDTHLYYGYLLMHLGRNDEAIRESQIALRLDPVSSRTQSALGRILYRARRYKEALPHLERAFELDPRSVEANYRLGDVYAQMGRYDEAIAAFEKIREVMPEGGWFQAGIARVYALRGRQHEARQMISGVKAAPYAIAGVYAALGDKDEAFRILEKAIGERQFIAPLKVEPPLENLHSDPRWQALLHRMNFPPE
jgi:TolB-like protein/Flp pilus assembly protein TadD